MNKRIIEIPVEDYVFEVIGDYYPPEKYWHDEVKDWEYKAASFDIDKINCINRNIDVKITDGFPEIKKVTIDLLSVLNIFDSLNRKSMREILDYFEMQCLKRI